MNKPLKADISKQAQRNLLTNKAFMILSNQAVIKELGNKNGLYNGTLRAARKLAAKLSLDNPSKTYIISNKGQYYCQFKAGTIHNKFNPSDTVDHKESSLIPNDDSLEGKLRKAKANRIKSNRSIAIIKKGDSMVKSQAVCKGKTVEVRKKERLAYYG